MQKISQMAKKHWFWLLTVLSLVSFGGLQGILSLMSHLFAGSLEVPLVVAMHERSPNAEWKAMENISFGGSVVLLHSAITQEQNFYISKHGSMQWERILFGRIGGKGSQISPVLKVRRRGADIGMDSFQATGGSLTAVVFVTDKAARDVVTAKRAEVRSLSRPILSARLISPAEGLAVGLIILLFGIGLGWCVRSGFDISSSDM